MIHHKIFMQNQQKIFFFKIKIKKTVQVLIKNHSYFAILNS